MITAKPKPVTDPKRFYGLYRGKVINNIDPLELNRLMVDVPTLPGVSAAYAMPCSPYGGWQVGMVFTPPIGADVWVEFENGDPATPVWVGCFWTEGMKPLIAELPTQQVFTTGSFSAMVNDIPGAAEFLMTWQEPGFAIPCSLSVNSAAVTLTVAENVFTMTAATTTAEMAPTTIAMTNASLNVETGGVVSVTAPEVSITGNLTQTGAVQVEGDTNITGAVQVEGETNITGAVTVEGDVTLIGVTEVTGELNVTGMADVEGDVVVMGALEVVGDVGLAGAVEFAGDVAMAGAVELAGNVALAGAFEVGGAVVSPVYSPGAGNML